MSSSPLGFFDSGIGGISLWMTVNKILPNENTIYLSDSKNCPYGNKPIIRVPEIYRFELNNGMKVSGIENSEVPLVRINIYIEGGQIHEKENKIGLSYLTARLMNKGTKNKNEKKQ